MEILADDYRERVRFLSQAGYLGVKLFPHQEQLMSSEPFQNVLNPWYFMYQPVFYRLKVGWERGMTFDA